MLQSLPIILFSNSQKPSLLFFRFLPIILKFMPVMLILRKEKKNTHTVVQQKSHCTCRKGVITGDSSSIYVLDELRLLELNYESYTPPFVHACHVVRAPTLALFLHDAPIISELCSLLMHPYYAGNYAGILCAGLLGSENARRLINVGGQTTFT